MVDSFSDRLGQPVTTVELVPNSHSREIPRHLFVRRRLPVNAGTGFRTDGNSFGLGILAADLAWHFNHGE
jgi:hypothetical protein